uniref:Uncharacterized protein n=1 Tax=Brassica oleracea TaxID=3712 RepID=A0A3P6G727_BRAOL|nr:unnamed protein product [Brassica oleracea]
MWLWNLFSTWSFICLLSALPQTNNTDQYTSGPSW